MPEKENHVHISARRRPLELKLGEVWQYRDLILLFTRRSFAVTYHQTILGPAWLLISPLLSSLIYLMLFGQIARLSTDGAPQLLFYLAGTAIWGFFSSCLTGNAGTFVSNAGLFGKVYFPRLTVPISNVLSAAIRFAVQLLLVLGFLAYYSVRGAVAPHWWAWLLIPLIVLQLGLLGMGCGVLISALTTKYRDLSVLISIGMQLWMFATPVVYPLSQLPAGALRTAILWNPVTAPVELFRWAVLGTGTVLPGYLAWSAGVTLAIALLGVMLFNRVERTFMDTV